jgi:thymidylate kinase
VSTPGIIVSVFGPDGVGKSTLIDKLGLALVAEFSGVVHCHFLHIQRPDSPRIVVNAPHAAEGRSRLVSLIKVLYYLVRAWALRVFILLPARARGSLVLIDRDVIDVAVDPIRYRMNAPRWAVNLLLKLGPKADVHLIMSAKPNIVMMRSGELSAEEFVRLDEGYRLLASHLPSAFILDAGQTPEDVTAQAERLILDSFPAP